MPWVFVQQVREGTNFPVYHVLHNDPNFSQWRHVQGEVNAMHKFDRHYYGMFGFLAIKEEDINVFSDNPDCITNKECLEVVKSK